MEEFLTNLKDIALVPTIISLIAIFVVGCLKLISGLKNMKSKDLRKAIYNFFNLCISAGLSVLYCLFITKTGWTKEMVNLVVKSMAEVNLLYPLYENFGLRALVKKIISLLIPSKSKQADKVVDAVADAVEEKISSNEVAEKQKESEKTGWLR